MMAWHLIALLALLPRSASPVPPPRVFTPGAGTSELELAPVPRRFDWRRPWARPSAAASAASYNASEISGDVAAEVARLRDQLDLFFAKELRHMRWYGLADGQRVCEIGCGPGHSTARFAAALPASTVRCVESSAAFVEHARAALRTAGVADRARVELGAAPDTGWPAGSCDVVSMRFVLQHLREPEGVLAEAVRLLAPGGILAATETDDMLGGVVDPYLPATQPALAAFAARQSARGGSRFIGRHLIGLMRQVGLRGLELNAVLAASDEDAPEDEPGAPSGSSDAGGAGAAPARRAAGASRFASYLDAGRYESLVGEGRLSRAELAAAAASVEALLADPSALVLSMNVLALGRKPRATGPDGPAPPDCTIGGREEK